MGTRHVREGLVSIEFPDDPRLGHAKGPQRAGGGMVFYNPAARDSRDFTVVILRTLDPPASGWRVLDGLAGSGVRGLRIRAEVPNVREVVINDGDPRAAAFAQRQVDAAPDGAAVSNRSLDAVLSDPSLRFDFIDIDPYGSPIAFFPLAAQRLARPGYIAVTATDVAALCGVYPEACIRRYGALPLRNEWMKETAARILVGALVRSCASADRAAEPLAVLSAEHYLRVFLRVRKGPRAADASLENVGYLVVDPKGDLAPATVPLRAVREGAALGPGKVAGPLWLGDLHDAALLQRAKVPEWIAKNSAVRVLLRDGPGEVGMPPYFYSLDELARRMRGSPPPTAAAVSALQAAGFRAARCHFHAKGLKTDASPADIRRVLAGVRRNAG